MKSFGIIGGDLRQLELARGLSRLGYPVFCCGFDQLEQAPPEQKTEALHSDVVVLPLPTAEGKTIKMPFGSEKLTFQEVLQEVRPDTLLTGGMVSPQLQQMAAASGLELIDYFQREELQVLNAIPTAEGAISLALDETGTTLHRCRCLILGFGRIGKLLAHRLHQMGCDVTVAARKCADLAWCSAYGYRPLPFANLAQAAPEAQIIFNTVPRMVLTEEILRTLPPDCLVIDLASRPGGVDLKAAQQLGVRCIWALSLPGKTAPVTSGEYIRDTILHILEERGE